MWLVLVLCVVVVRDVRHVTIFLDCSSDQFTIHTIAIYLRPTIVQEPYMTCKRHEGCMQNTLRMRARDVQDTYKVHPIYLSRSTHSSW